MSGFVKLNRTEKTLELLKDINAFALVTIIAFRTKRSNDFNVHGLQVGEAFIGDFKNYGLTGQKYRTAKKKLQKWKIATFKATNKGTIASLLNTDIYDTNNEDTNEQANSPATNKQQTSNEPATTIKKLRSKEVKKGSGDFVPPTLSEVSEYVKSIGFNLDAQYFIDSYTAKGWMIGKNKMKDWKASVRTWWKNGFENKTKGVQSPDHKKTTEDRIRKTYSDYIKGASEAKLKDLWQHEPQYRFLIRELRPDFVPLQQKAI